MNGRFTFNDVFIGKIIVFFFKFNIKLCIDGMSYKILNNYYNVENFELDCLLSTFLKN